jgi:hypothetical protein
LNPSVAHVKKEILLSGTEDWVHIAEIIFFAREAFFEDRLKDGYPDDADLSVERLAAARDQWSVGQEKQAMPLAIIAVKELLRESLVRVGETADRRFVPWVGSTDEVEKRIDDLVEAAEFPLLPGHLFWLENTPLGTEKVQD